MTNLPSFLRRWTIGRSIILAIGGVCAVIGTRVANDNYLQRKMLEACLAGKPCLIQNQTTFDLAASLKNADIGLGVGVVLLALGVIMCIYSIFFAGPRDQELTKPSQEGKEGERF